MIVAVILLQILSCLTNPDPPTLSSWIFNRHDVLSVEVWNEWQHLEGRDIVIRLDDTCKFETTGDERWAGRLIGEDYEVWLFYSPTREEYDLLPFADTTIYPDENGVPYAMHPCGGWAVDADIIDALIESDD